MPARAANGAEPAPGETPSDPALTAAAAPMQHFRAPRWLPGGHLQTIWPALFSRPRLRRHPPTGASAGARRTATSSTSTSSTRRTPRRPLLVLFHGLEGSSRSHYALAFAHRAARLGWRYAVPHFRGCSGELNLAPRAYHSGDFEEIGWMLERLRARQAAPMLAVGVSLGGNALLRWAEEAGDTAARHGTRGGRGVLADRPGRRRPRHRPRLQPAGLHPHVPAHHEGQGAAQVAAAPGPVRPRAAARGAHAVRIRRPLHRPAARLSRHRRLLGAAPRPSRTCSASASRRWCSTRATTPSCRPPRPRRTRSARFVTLWQPAHGGHVGFPPGRFPATCTACPRR